MMKNNRILYSTMIGLVSCMLTTQALAAKFDPLYMDLTISGNIQLPLPCTISGDDGVDAIPVRFGTVNTTQVDGANYRQKINYSIKCEPGAETALALSIKGDSAGFGNGVLKVDAKNPNLGIKISYGGGNTALPLGTVLPFTYPNFPTLYATPVKRTGSALTAGAFKASATLYVSIH